MKLEDIKELFKRIKSHYQMFTTDEAKLKEWHRFLKDYSKEDVFDNFDKYLMQQHEQPPMVITLNRGLKKTIEEPEQLVYVQCDLCKQKILVGDDWDAFDKHYRKCKKIDFIDRQSKQIRGEGINKEKYYSMTDEELEQNYRPIMDYFLKNNNGTILKRI